MFIRRTPAKLNNIIHFELFSVYHYYFLCHFVHFFSSEFHFNSILIAFNHRRHRHRRVHYSWDWMVLMMLPRHWPVPAFLVILLLLALVALLNDYTNPVPLIVAPADSFDRKIFLFLHVYFETRFWFGIHSNSIRSSIVDDDVRLGIDFQQIHSELRRIKCEFYWKLSGGYF